MNRERRILARMLRVLLSLFLLGGFTAQVLFAAEGFTSDKHIKTGLTCENCHGTAKVAPGAEVGTAKCLSCHESYEKLAKRTEAMIRNPHTNPHSLDLDCNACHHGHGADENHCSRCHRK